MQQPDNFLFYKCVALERVEKYFKLLFNKNNINKYI